MNRLTPLALLAVVALALSPVAAAHKTTYTPDGSVKVVWGFLNEPAVTMTKTGLDLTLTDNATGAPIEGAEGTLDVSLRYGEEVHRFDDFRAQHGQKGKYTGVVTLTQPGVYYLVLKGTLNGTAVDLEIPSQHEIAGIEETYFPAYEPADVAALAAKVAALEAKVAALESKAATQSDTPATVTRQDDDVPAPGVLLVLAALGAVAVALALRRRA